MTGPRRRATTVALLGGAIIRGDLKGERCTMGSWTHHTPRSLTDRMRLLGFRPGWTGSRPSYWLGHLALLEAALVPASTQQQTACKRPMRS